MLAWERIQGPAASVNLIALTEHGWVCVYVVPRNCLFRRAAGFAGLPGALECAGLFVVTTEREYERLQSGALIAVALRSALAGVRPAATDHLTWAAPKRRVGFGRHRG
jgi:hypothetical protein